MAISRDQMEKVVAAAMRDRRRGLETIEAAKAQDHLIDFIRLMWGVLEPGRKFVDGWAIRAICEHLEAVTLGQIKRLLINVPPGFMKSLTTDVFWPAWEWGPRSRPDLRYVSSSYSDALTKRDNLKCRTLMKSERYQKFWSSRFKFNVDQDAKTKFENDHTGFKLATSVGGLGTGERGDRFIIDDPHNVKEAESEAYRNEVLHWFSEVVPTRINDPMTSAIVIIMQRVHERDVSGLILSEGLDYEWLNLPMNYEVKHRSFTCVKREGVKPQRMKLVKEDLEPIPTWTPDESGREVYPQDQRKVEDDLLWPERFSEDYIENQLKPSLRAFGGTYAEAGQLQQRPAPRGGGLFKRTHFQIIDSALPAIFTVRGWDFAASKDGRAAYTACVKMSMSRDKKIVIEDVRRKRCSPHEVEQMIMECARSDGKSVHQSFPQDPAQAGKSQKAHLATKLHGYKFSFSSESGSKEDRAQPLVAQSEAGNLFLVRAQWNDSFVAEACLFPNGRYKDQVDGASRAYAKLISRRTAQVAFVAPVLIEAT